MVFVPVYAETVSFTNGNPTWYAYDCSDAPSTFTLSGPSEGSKFQYYSFIQAGVCYSNIIGYNMVPLADMVNATEILFRADTKGRHVTNPSLSTNYNVTCNLFYFEDLETLSNSISETPTKVDDFNCAVASDTSVQTNTINFTSTIVNHIQSRITNNNTQTIYFMVIPNYTAGFVSGLSSASFGIEKYIDRLTITGDNFDCTIIFESNMCGWLEDPWAAVRKMLGEDYIGEWFYVLIWFPFPMVAFLATRNGTYAGFLGLGIMLVIQTISKTVFEIALTMVIISAGFTFYEAFRKRLMVD
jgi:hypothetical protein